MPQRSTRAWCLLPGLPWSVGAFLVFCPARRTIQACTRKVDPVGVAQASEEFLPLPDARGLPASRSLPAGHPAAAAHLLGRSFPLDARVQDNENPRQRRAVRDRGPTPVGRGGAGGTRGSSTAQSIPGTSCFAIPQETRGWRFC